MEGQQQPVMANPIAAEGAAYPGQYPGTYAVPQGQYPGAQPFSGGYQTTGGQQGYAQPQPQGYAPQYGAPQYGGAPPGYGVAAVPAGAYPQQVVYVQQPRVVYGYTYGERARMVYWGSPYARILTIVFIVMVIIGIVLEATSPTGCGSGCTTTTCVDSVYHDSYPCTCRGGTTCENEQFGPQGQAGAALISIGVIALIIQSCIACGCCGSCCLPPQPVVVQRPPMMVASAQPVYAPPMQQPHPPMNQPQNPPMQTGY